MLEILKGFAKSPEDSEDLEFRKILILIIASSCSFFGLIWSGLYYFVFGAGLTAFLPFLFVLIVGLAIVLSHFTRNHKILIYGQLACITWISALIQWSIGSMDSAAVVIAWSFLGPLGALIFLSRGQALFWIGQFTLIVVISAVIDPML